MSKFKSWIIAFRLRTLPLAFSGWLIGIAIAKAEDFLSYLVAALTLLTAFLLQILSNLANDYGDAVSGVDSSDRKGPDRMVQTGQITKKEMSRAMIICSSLALLTGCLLLYIAFPNDFKTAILFLAIGLLAITAAIKYTVGKNPYGYVGFGDVFVFLFFGVVLVFGTYFLQTKHLNLWVLLPATSLGLFSIGVLNVNNIRDIESDKQSGKHSIPVRIGRQKATLYHAFLLLGGIFSSVLYVIFNFSSAIQLLFLLVMILFIRNISAVGSKPLDQLDPYLKQMALSTLLFSILFSLGLLLV